MFEGCPWALPHSFWRVFLKGTLLPQDDRGNFPSARWCSTDNLKSCFWLIYDLKHKSGCLIAQADDSVRLSILTKIFAPAGMAPECHRIGKAGLGVCNTLQFDKFHENQRKGREAELCWCFSLKGVVLQGLCFHQTPANPLGKELLRVPGLWNGGTLNHITYTDGCCWRQPQDAKSIANPSFITLLPSFPSCVQERVPVRC